MGSWYPAVAAQVLTGLDAQIRPSLTKFIEAAGYLPPWDILLMQIAYGLAPARLAPSLLIERVPYTRPNSFFERMMAAAQRGWLHENQTDFALTAPGHEIVAGMHELGDRLYAKIATLPGPELTRLMAISDDLIAKIKSLPEPHRKPAFELSLRFDRGAAVPSIVQLRQRLLVLLAFHDDTNMVSWRPYETDGRLWETFTLIWQQQAGSADELAHLLPHRNYAKRDYAAALAELHTRGWITRQDDRFTVTAQAAQMRQAVEDRTDQLFTAAFTRLSRARKNEFKALMGKFAMGVKDSVVAIT